MSGVNEDGATTSGATTSGATTFGDVKSGGGGKSASPSGAAEVSKATKGAQSMKDGSELVEDQTMQADDIAFILSCIRNSVGDGVITVDVKAVADARNYKNTGSVANRIARLKKKFNLPIAASSTSCKKADASPAPAKTPNTPGKITPSKVTKVRSTRRTAAKAKKSAKTVAGSDGDSSEEKTELESSAKGKKSVKGVRSALSKPGSHDDMEAGEEETGDQESEEEVIHEAVKIEEDSDYDEI